MNRRIKEERERERGERGEGDDKAKLKDAKSHLHQSQKCTAN